MSRDIVHPRCAVAPVVAAQQAMEFALGKVARDVADERCQMRSQLAVFVMVAVYVLSFQAGSADASEPTAAGLWEQTDATTGKPVAWFLVSEHDGVYDATLVKVFAKPGRKPNHRCTGCLGDQRNAPWLGLMIIKEMERQGFEYEKGTIVDPRDGSEFYGRMRLSPDGQTLTVRGYLGINPLGGDQRWRRLPEKALSDLDLALASDLDPALSVGCAPTLQRQRSTRSSTSSNSVSRSFGDRPGARRQSGVPILH